MSAARTAYPSRVERRVEGQGTGARSGQNQVPSNAMATLPRGAPDISLIKMVDYDFATFGSPEERSRLLGRFDAEITATN